MPDADVAAASFDHRITYVSGLVDVSSPAIAFVLLGVALLTGVGGCAGMSPSDNSKFLAVVAKNVSVEMPLVTAIEQ
jgi:hypothetical protein